MPLQISDHMALYFLFLFFLGSYHFLFQHILKYRAVLSLKEAWMDPAEDPGEHPMRPMPPTRGWLGRHSINLHLHPKHCWH